jgi:putative transposase
MFIEAHKTEYPVSTLCRLLRVCRSGFYAWKSRPESQRVREDRALLAQIERIHRASREAYGTVKTWRTLKARGVACGRNRVARLRASAGIEAKRMRRFRVTTQSRHSYPIADNLLDRVFSVSRPNRVWVGDITFIPTQAGWLYLAILVDLFARKVVGWAMSRYIDRELVTRALAMALERRRPMPGLIHHTDQGRQYATESYRQRLIAHGISPSMSRKGDCFDNACAESFMSTLKNELTHHLQFHTREEAKTAIFEYIEVFYNRQRLHQTLGYLSPAEYERRAGVS